MIEDRRIKRTQDAIIEAFLTLSTEKGYEHVSVKDIVDKANVGRTTFYAHYNDKDDLLNKLLSTMFSAMSDALSLEDSADISPARALFEHIDSHGHLQKSFDFELISRKFQEEVFLIVKRQLARQTITKNKKHIIDMKAEIISGGLISLIKWWLKTDKPYSAKEMADMFQQIVTEGI